MRKNAKQISEVPHDTPEGKEEVRAWLRPAAAREIQDYIHCIPISAHNERFQLARCALELRISEDAAQAATKLEQQVDRFVQQMDKLLGIAEAQKLLAAKLERQTNRLICLTYVLVFLTVALLAAAYAQTRVMLKEVATTHQPEIETSQHGHTPSTNR
jgi:TolA-binding protein